MLTAALSILFSAVCYSVDVVGQENEPQYIGCYDTYFVKNNKFSYTADTLPSSSNTPCARRLTVYMGVQVLDHRLYEYYCGNDILEHSVRVDDSACVECGWWSKCGLGIVSVALYRLRDNSPLAVLAATEKGIKVFKENESETIVETSTMYDVDFSYDADDIFTLAGSSLLRFSFDRHQKKYKNTTLLKPSMGMTDLAYDWEVKRIFWSNSRGPDFIIYECNLFYSGSLTTILTTKRRTKDLTVDPFKSMLFFVDESGSLFSYSLNNKNLRNYTKSVGFHMKHLAVDTHKQLIYAVGRKGNQETYTMMSIDYEDTERTIIFEGPELTNPYSVDVFNNEIVWLNTVAGEQVYRCRLTPHCKPLILFSTSENTYDIKIYHPDKQAPPEWYLCEALGCSHICARVSEYVAKCSCPPGMTLTSDQITCQVEMSTVKMDLPTTTTQVATTLQETSSTIPHNDDRTVHSTLSDEYSTKLNTSSNHTTQTYSPASYKPNVQNSRGDLESRV